jgi:1-acyl-sn-glycerol-3-phosphate acyltransferase
MVLFPHLLKVLAEPRLDVEVRFLDVIEPRGQERRALADAAHQAVRSVVVDSGTGKSSERI